MKSERRDYAQEIVDQILALLNAGTLPWRACWDRSGRNIMPMRLTGQPYSGINTVALLASAMMYGYVSGTWATYRQIAAAGGQVRKGERGRPVVYYGALQRPAGNESTDDRSIRYLRYYTVFNLSAQTENLPAHYYDAPKQPAPASIPDVEAWVERIGAEIRWGGVGAYYDPQGGDYIRMPARERFTDGAMMMATLLHELTHWTGAKHRLDRLVYSDRKEDQAREELVAEIGAAMLGAKFGLPASHIEDHASYIGHWITHLQEDPKALFAAAAKAQAAVGFLEGIAGPISRDVVGDRGDELPD